MLRDLLPRVAFAVNRAYVKGDAQLSDGDELALIPPVSGG
jgi:molybdopterin converting factor small subunit